VNKDTQRLLRAVTAAGGTYQLRKSGHYRITGPGGHYFTAATPSDWRSLRNTIAGLRSVGLDLRDWL
jgi:hypothetical protein